MKRPKKKSNFSSVLLGGCGAILFLALAAVATVLLIVQKKSNEYLSHPVMFEAEQVVADSPDLEIVGMDAEKSMMTIRHKGTGETMTLYAADVKDGNFSFQGHEHEGGEGATIEAKGEAALADQGKIAARSDAKER
ncbi:MAG: hypothetical protein LBC63_05235 [Holophagales bacterium]|jgi:hypothetical protein|nr:hypothetical protein [Holophagales bacterium]